MKRPEAKRKVRSGGVYLGAVVPHRLVFLVTILLAVQHAHEEVRGNKGRGDRWQKGRDRVVNREQGKGSI